MIHTGNPKFKGKSKSNKKIGLPKVRNAPRSALPIKNPNEIKPNIINDLKLEKVKHQKRVSELLNKQKNSIKRKTFLNKKSIKTESNFSKKSSVKKKQAKENINIISQLSTFKLNKSNDSSEISNNSIMFNIDKEHQNNKSNSKDLSENMNFEKTNDVKAQVLISGFNQKFGICLLYTSPSPRD